MKTINAFAATLATAAGLGAAVLTGAGAASAAPAPVLSEPSGHSASAGPHTQPDGLDHSIPIGNFTDRGLQLGDNPSAEAPRDPGLPPAVAAQAHPDGPGLKPGGVWHFHPHPEDR